MDKLEKVSDFAIEMWNYVSANGSKTKLTLLSTLAGIIILNSYAFYLKQLKSNSLNFFILRLKNYFKQLRYFKKLNIPGPTPLPFIGNFHLVLTQGFNGSHEILIKKYGKTVGFFDGKIPIILTADVNLIKNITIRDFQHFVNRTVFYLD